MVLTPSASSFIKSRLQFDHVFGSTTFTFISKGADSASGLSMLFQTNTSIVYMPISVDVQDCAGENDWRGESEPVSQDKDTTVLSEFFT